MNRSGVRRPELKILSRESMVAERARLRKAGLKLVFTNGCFDILHPGHIDYLLFARNQGDALVVGVNSDSSVKRNKGQDRPIVPERDRALVLAGLESVDYVVVFEEDEPAPLVNEILPDVLVKGEDWRHFVSGREAVEAAGGKVVLAPIVPNRSTTDIIGRVLAIAARKGSEA